MPANRKRILWGALGALLVAAGWLVVMIISGVLEQRRQENGDAGVDAGTEPDGAVSAPVAQPEPPAEPSGPAYALVGTVVASDPRWSRASILAGDQRLLNRLGDRLPDGSQVVRILDDRVILQTLGGDRWTLRLEERPAQPAREPPASKAEPGSPPGELSGVEREGEGIYRLDRSALDAALEEVDELMADVRVSLAFDDDGGVTGMRLGLDRPGTVFERIGLEDGDLLVRVAGMLVDSPQALSDLTALLREAREVDVEIERDGRTDTLRYFIDEE